MNIHFKCVYLLIETGFPGYAEVTRLDGVGGIRGRKSCCDGVTQQLSIFVLFTSFLNIVHCMRRKLKEPLSFQYPFYTNVIVTRTDFFTNIGKLKTQGRIYAISQGVPVLVTSARSAPQIFWNPLVYFGTPCSGFQWIPWGSTGFQGAPIV